MATLKIYILLVFCACPCYLQAESSYNAKSRLEATLLANYSQEVRPVLNHGDNVTVTVGVSLSRIQDMNDKQEILTLSLWIRQFWYDPRLTWNDTDYAMTKQVHVDPKKIWVPDLKVYNEVGAQKDSGLDQLHTKAIIYSNGKIKWMSPSVKKLSCNVNMQYFPHDTQKCRLKIGSWTYDGFALDLKRESMHMEVSKSPSNPEWELVETFVERNVVEYNCCPEPYPDITYIIVIKRRERSYWINFIFPGIFLTVITMTAFITSASDTGERIGLVLTSLVSMFFFLKLVSERTPASDTIPLLSVYFVVLSFEIGLMLYSASLSLNAYHKHTALGDMPNYIRNLVLNKLGNFWRLDEDRKHILRRLRALQNISLMKKRVKKELECMKNGINCGIDEYQASNGLNAIENGMCSNSRGDEGSAEHGTRNAMSTSDCYVERETAVNFEYISDSSCSLSSGNDKVHKCSCRSAVKHLIKVNNKLLLAVRQIIYVARQVDKKSSEKETWLIAATILDRIFLVLFVLFFIALSLVNFLW